MGTTLTGLTPANTYDALIKVGDNGPLSATAKYVGDGLGNDSVVALSTSSVGIGTTSPTQLLHVAGNVRITGALYDGNNAAGTSGQILSSTGTGTDWVSKSDLSLVDGSGTANYVSKWSDTDTLTNSLIYDNGSAVGIGNTSPAAKLDVTGTLAVSGNAAFDTNVLFVDAASNEVGIGTASPQSIFHIGADAPANAGAKAYTGLASTAEGFLFDYYYDTTASNLRLFDIVPLGFATTGIGGSALRFLTVPQTTTNTPLERMRITSTGDVGIGNSSPVGKLHIAATTGVASLGSTALAIRDSSAPTYGFDFTLEGVSTGDMSLVRTELGVQSQVMTFKRSNGNVGIGTVSASQRLSVEDSASTNPTLVSLTSSFGTGRGASISLANDDLGAEGAALKFTTNVAAPYGGYVFSTQGGERMRITGAGNVGIGTSSPAAYSKLQVKVGTDFNLAIGQDSGALGLGAYNDALNASADLNITAANITFSSGGERMRITSTGDVSITTGNILLSGAGGIYFDSGASKYLDDYEVGTWTMGVAFGGASVGVTYFANTGTYTKIGRQVTVNGYISLTSKGSSTGAASITGLPFTIPNSIQNYAAASLWINNITFANQYNAVGSINNTRIVLEEVTELGVSSGLTNADFANNSELIVNFTYFV